MSDPVTGRSYAARGRAYKSWACTADRSARTSPGRRAFDERFEREVDPDRKLSDAERAVRVGYARKAYFLELAARSAKARARRARIGREDAELATELTAAVAELTAATRLDAGKSAPLIGVDAIVDGHVEGGGSK